MPERVLGRINARCDSSSWGTMPIRALIGGALGSAIGLRPTLWIAAAGAFVPILSSLAPLFGRFARSPTRLATRRLGRTAPGKD